MSEAGPSGSAQKHRNYKSSRGGWGGDRGGRGRGRGVGRGRGRGGGWGGGGGSGRGGHGDDGERRGRGGGGGGRGGRGGRGGSRGGAPWMRSEGSGPKLNPLGRYREDPPLDGLCAPGIIVTAVMHKERSAEKELIHFLETIADEVYPETIEAEVKREDGAEEDLDLEEMLKRELEGMGGDKKSKRFRLCTHDTQCVLYINVLPPLSPVRLVHHLLSTIESTAQNPLKNVKRLIPVEATSAATIHQLGQIAEGVVKKGFETEDGRGLKFAIHTNSRNSDRLDRLDMIKRVADEVVALGNGHTVDLKSPDRTVLVEVNKNLLGISVVRDYERFRKYNVSAVAEAAAKAQHAASVDPAQSTQSTQTTNTVPTDTSAPASGPSADTSEPEHKKNTKHQNRVLAAAKLTEAHKASAVPSETGTKRKAEEMEAGEVPPEEEVEKGELVEVRPGEEVELEGFEEIVEGGRVLKFRREE